jgi:hypothetical protein
MILEESRSDTQQKTLKDYGALVGLPRKERAKKTGWRGQGFSALALLVVGFREGVLVSWL